MMIFVLPRNKAFIPVFLGACFFTLGQQIMIGPFHFFFVRIIILFGFIRIIARRELSEIRLNKIDAYIIIYVVVSTILNIILYHSIQGVIYRLGVAYNVIGSYFLFRAFIRDPEDIFRVFRVLSLIIIPLGISMTIEKMTGRNFFSILGGVPEFSEIRDGDIRCQGSFSHPILMGTFGATLIPFIVSLWYTGRHRFWTFISFVAASIVTLTAASSGPLMAYATSFVGLAMIIWRDKMSLVRKGIVFSLIFLHFAMKAPVWYIFAKLSSVLGGTGWHRAYLIDQALHYLNDWWLIGTIVTVHWIGQSIPDNPESADITNMYLVQGVNGGLLTMALFIIIIVLCFKQVGRAMDAAQGECFELRMMIWSLGGALFGHVISFLSVSYFDQIIVFWYLLLALISTLHSGIELRAQEEESNQTSQESTQAPVAQGSGVYAQ
ncbi:MAG: hypothetical protein JW795_10340 [Chitinivibrionales bacterium]|nr:hypothetical protein [Chitinivibrionales bacterium]